MYWSARPFVRIFLFLASGIYVAFNFGAVREVPLFAYYAAIILLLIIAVILLPKKLSYSAHRIKGVVAGAALFLTGILITLPNLPPVPGQQTATRGTYLGIITSQPSSSDKTIKAVVIIKKRFDTLQSNLPQKAVIYLEKKGNKALNYGDEIIFSATLKPPEAPGNPYQFNYKLFLKAKGIGLVAYIPANSYQIIGNNPPNIVTELALKLRNKTLKALRENGLTGEQYAVAAAIVLGYDDVMNDEIRQNYQRAGAMHVLCVSGLHVGVIYLVLASLLGFLNKSRKQKIVKTTVLLAAVWMYALLTGMAPSVMRATVMISFIIIGNEIERDKDAYNTLAMSAVFLLVYDPGFLFNVGFRLSYAAVLGIVTFYRPLYRLFYFKNIVIDKLWSATAVSMAAQAGAFPVAAMYFHFFPVWFLLSNLIIMLFSTIIISAGMLFILFSWVPVISGWIATALSGMIFLMNYLISIIGNFPVAGINDLYFPALKVILIYLMLIFGYNLIVLRKAAFTIPVLSTVLLLIIFETSHRYETLTQNKIIIYDAGYHHTAIDFINGENHLLLCDSALINDPRKIDFFTENSRIAFGLKKNFSSVGLPVKPNNIALYGNGNIFVFNNRIIVKEGTNNFHPLTKPLKVDVLWITAPGNINTDKLLKTFSPLQVVISLPACSKKTKTIKDAFSELQIPVHETDRNGAYIH